MKYREANPKPLTEEEIEFLTSRGYEISRSMHGPLMEIRQRVKMTCDRCRGTGDLPYGRCFNCDDRGYFYADARIALRRIQRLEEVTGELDEAITKAFLTAEAECYVNEANGFGYVTNAELVTEALIAELAHFMPDDDARAFVVSAVWSDVVQALALGSKRVDDFADRFARLIEENGLDPRGFTENQKRAVTEIFARVGGRRGSEVYRMRYRQLTARLFLWDQAERVVLGRVAQIAQQTADRMRGA